MTLGGIVRKAVYWPIPYISSAGMGLLDVSNPLALGGAALATIVSTSVALHYGQKAGTNKFYDDLQARYPYQDQSKNRARALARDSSFGARMSQVGGGMLNGIVAATIFLGGQFVRQSLGLDATVLEYQ